MRIVFTVSALVVLLAACGHQLDSDAALRSKIAGTWTTADFTLPDEAKVSGVTTTFQPDGIWRTRYTITGVGDSRKQTTSGTWQIEDGCMIELQTSVDGNAYPKEQPGSSKIMTLNSYEMILSNWYSPRRIFSREQ